MCQVICLSFAGIICLHPCGQRLGTWPVQAPGPAWPFTCFVILADVPCQLSKAFFPRPVSLGDDPMGLQAGAGVEKYKLLYKSTQPILYEHLLCAGGSDQEFTVLEKCNSYTGNPRGANGHMVTCGQKAALCEKRP